MAQTRRMVVAAIGLGIALCLGTQAQQPSAAASTATPSASADGLLSETQRELQTLPALERGLSDAKANSPTLALPALSAPAAVETPAPAPLSPRDQQRAIDELRRQRAARNWLLDAMRRPEPGQPADPVKTKQERDEALAALLFPTRGGVTDHREPTLDVVSEALRAADEAGRHGVSETPASLQASNPLETFLGAWMTPRDFALLGPGAASDPSAVLPQGPRAMPLPSTSSAGFDAPSVMENPYLRNTPALGELETDGGLPGVPRAVFPSHSEVLPPSGVLGPVVPLELGGAKTPEGSGKTPAATRYQPPPSVDQKYFPQLKRF